MKEKNKEKLRKFLRLKPRVDKKAISKLKEHVKDIMGYNKKVDLGKDLYLGEKVDLGKGIDLGKDLDFGKKLEY